MVHFHYGRGKITIEGKGRSITIIIEAVSPGSSYEIFLIKNLEFNKYVSFNSTIFQRKFTKSKRNDEFNDGNVRKFTSNVKATEQRSQSILFHNQISS